MKSLEDVLTEMKAVGVDVNTLNDEIDLLERDITIYLHNQKGVVENDCEAGGV